MGYRPFLAFPHWPFHRSCISIIYYGPTDILKTPTPFTLNGDDGKSLLINMLLCKTPTYRQKCTGQKLNYVNYSIVDLCLGTWQLVGPRGNVTQQSPCLRHPSRESPVQYIWDWRKQRISELAEITLETENLGNPYSHQGRPGYLLSK